MLVSRDSAYAVRTNVSVIEVSRTLRGIPSEVDLSRRDGLPKKCVANADNIVTIPKVWLKSQVTTLSAVKMKLVDRALTFSLGLDG